MYLILSFIQSDYVIVSVSIWRFVSDVQTSVPHKHYTGIDMTLKSINRESFESEPTTQQPLIKFYTNRQQLQPCQVKEQRKVYNTKEQRPSKLKCKWNYLYTYE